MARKISAEVGIEPTTKLILTALVADVNALRTANAFLVAKLDADATVTDTDYAALCTPAAATVTA